MTLSNSPTNQYIHVCQRDHPTDSHRVSHHPTY